MSQTRLANPGQHWRRLLMIAVSGSAMIATPHLAHAAITEDPPASGQYTASGANNSTQVLSGVANAQVTTAPGFSVNTPTGIALSITGTGALSYTDANASELITTANAYSLDMYSTGNAPDTTPGSVTIVSNGNITGGNSGVRVRNNGTGSVSIALTGEIEGVGNDGISVLNNDVAAGNVEIEVNQVTAGNRGVYVINNGAGNTEITTTGAVAGGQYGIWAANNTGGNLTITAEDTITATNLDGVNATNGTGTGNLTVEVNDVTAGRFGVRASNSGTGDISITANGIVTGGQHGIVALHEGTGNTEVIAYGVVTSTTSSAILVESSAGAATVDANEDVNSTEYRGIDIENSGAGNTTVDAVNITAGTTGIWAVNSTSGDLDIEATGTIEAASQDGVNATNGTGTGSLTVEVNDVTAGRWGVRTSNSGTGDTSITANGAVTGGQHGIVAINEGTGNTEVTAHGVVTSTTSSAIQVENRTSSAGAATITANDDVISTEYRGIDVENSGTGNTTVDVVDVTAGVTGIWAVNSTAGDLDIDATGTITATSQDGVNATNGAGTGNLTVEVNDVTAGRFGVRTSNSGTGDTSITADGVVTGGQYGIVAINEGTGVTEVEVTANGIAQGATAGVSASSSGSQAIEINVDGEVRNSTLASSALAVSSTSGVVTLNNNSLITGTVSLGNQGNTFNNADTWNTAGGFSTLGAGVNTLDNQLNANILAATTAGSVDTTVTGVGTFIHSGDLVLQNTDARIGGLTSYTGDVLTLTNGGSGEFESNGGALYIDTNIDDLDSDRIAVDNVVVTGGATTVFINVIDPGRATTGDGIEVVDVAGTSENDAFVLAAPIQAGLFDYNLGQGSSDTQSWFLQSSLRDEVVAAGALSVLGSRTALATLSNLNERQRGGEGFTDDQDARKGVWARVFGQDTKFRSDGGSNAGFNANTWGAQAGLDLVAQESENGARKYAGVYVGYATSNGDALNGSSRIGRLDVDATSVGVYFTKYSPKGWYADATAQYSKLDGIRIRAGENSLRPDGKSYAASLEFGQRFNLEKKLIPELQAQLIYQKTDIDDVTLSDSTRLSMGNVNAVTGRLGVRLSKNPAYAGRFQPWVRANLWHTLKTGAEVSSQGSTADTHVGGTSGEVQVGFALAPSQAGGWSAYVAGGYLFDLSGSEYSGWKGTLGVRKGW